MKILKDFCNRFYLYILSFFIVFFIFTLTLFVCRINPFGNNTYIIGDMEAQFYPFLFKFKSIIFNHEFVYNWSGGLGSPIYGLFFTYLSSPINLISLLFDDNHIEYAIHAILLIKISLTCFSMIFYLSKRLKKKSILLLIPSLLYTFCGFFLYYYKYIQWLDMMFLLPILTYSIERLIEDNKSVLYIITIVIIIISNIYMGYMLCIYTAIYFCIYNLIYTKGTSIKNKINNMSRNFLIILGSTIIALLIVSPVIYLYYSASQSFGNIGGGFPVLRYYDFTYSDFLLNHFEGIEFILDENNHLVPLVYCGVLSLMMIIPFVFNKQIDIKTKMLLLSLLIVFILFFRIPILDFIINVFHVPNGAPYRYSFIYSFVLCIALGYSLTSINNKKLILFSSFVLLTFLIVNKINNNIYIQNNDFIINIVFIILLTIILMLPIKRKKVILLFITILEISLSMINRYNSIGLLKTSFSDMNNDYSYISCDYYSFSVNSGYIYDFSSLSIFDSTENSDISMLLNKFGIYADPSHIECGPNTPIFNTLFNIKYINSKYLLSDYYNTILDDKYLFNYSLSKVYGVDDYFENELSEDALVNQNMIADSFTGIKDILVKVDYEVNEVFKDSQAVIYEYTFPVKDVYYSHDKNSSIFMVIDQYNNIFSNYGPNKKFLEKLGITDYNLFYYDGSFINSINNNRVRIAYFNKNKEIEHPVFYTIDKEKFDKMYDYLYSHQMNVSNLDTYGLEGNVDLDKDMKMFTVIPYDDNWKVYVDGNRVESYKVLNTLLGFELSKGKHNIKIKYEDGKLFKIILLSIITIVSFIMYNIYKKVKINGKLRTIQE